ncbi:type II toxin-antitoxin system Phd/YefM family antitoxin [Clostridiales bacterium COT073_COT-073]|nr:type II toxin-antitoxin system Phd/YefM family antitoxin [Clostridiales bacterium COT073_COT-073]
MLAANDSTIRSKFKEYCDQATDHYETIIVTRKEEKNVVILSLEKYNDIMKAVRNAEFLNKIDKSIKQKEDGKVVIKTMQELEAMENQVLSGLDF